MTVDGSAAAKGHRLQGGERIVVEEPTPPRPGAGGARRAVRGRLGGRAPAGRRQAGGRGRPSRPRTPNRHARPGAGRPRRGRRGGRGAPASCIGSTATRPGLLVVAKSDAAHRTLQAALKARRIKREYLALVEGRPPARSGTIDAPLGRDRRSRILHSIDTDEPPRGAHALRGRAALPATTLLRVRLETGRTHQIRAHLHAIGHPVVWRSRVRATRGCSASSASSCTRRGSRSPTRCRGRRSTSCPRCRRSSRRRSNARDAGGAPGGAERRVKPIEATRLKARPRCYYQQAPAQRQQGHAEAACRPASRTGPPEVGEGRAGPHTLKRGLLQKLADHHCVHSTDRFLPGPGRHEGALPGTDATARVPGPLGTGRIRSITPTREQYQCQR